MKILMINVSCGSGSTGRICTDLATALENKGIEVKIAYGRDEVQSKFERFAVKIGSNYEVHIHALKSRLFDAAGLGSYSGTKKFIEWIVKWNPDIIHLHNVHGYYVNVPLLFDFLKQYGKPIIWTLHDCWPFTGHTAFCDSVNCEKWKSGCGRCPLLKEYPKSYSDCSRKNWHWKKNAFTNIPKLTLVTPSSWLAGLVKESFISEYPVKVIHNGIDTSVFKPLPNDFKKHYGIEGKKVILGVSSVWNDLKGFRDFISLSKIIDSETAIVLVGVTKEQKKNLPPNIIGIQRTDSPKELAYIYSSADVFLNLTYCDNYPTTNLEAKACCTPIITYNTGGSPESAGDNAIVVSKGDVYQVYVKIRSLFDKGIFKSNVLQNVNDINDTVRDYIDQYSKSLN